MTIPYESLVVVDVQPNYFINNQLIVGIARMVEDCVNDSRCEVVVLYNGADTLGPPYPTEDQLREWYMALGAESLAKANFFDKGYAFFRGCMDSGFAHDAIVPIVAYMFKNGISDSRELDFEDLRNAGVTEEWEENLVQLLENSEESLFIPMLMAELQPLSEPVAVVGGYREECLAEVLIALEALGKQYAVIEELTY